MKVRSGISLFLMVLLTTVLHCSVDDKPGDRAVTGNSQLLDFHEEFTPPRRGAQTEEYRNTTQNTRIFKDSLDIDGNGQYDLMIKYLFAEKIHGDTTVITSIEPLHQDIFLLGDTVIFGGISYWDQRVYDEGKTITRDTDFRDTNPNTTFLYDFDYWFKNEGSGFIDDLTKFPQVPEGYVAFKLETGDEIRLGWFKIRLAHPGRVPEIEEIGYRLF